MNRRLVTSLAIAGLVFAVFGTVILQFGRFSIGEAAFCGAFAVAAAVLGCFGILLEVDTMRRLAITTLVLVGVSAGAIYLAGIALSSSATGHIGQTAVSNFPTTFIPWLALGILAYLAAATTYGFVGTAHGVTVQNRVGLLLLLLLAVIPVANILGLAGLVVTTLRRKVAA
ncbi:MAG: hypothetical protein QOF79_2510 [Actinomycetota bacterium]|nr:hypothetical protein [Actinomycetota bacterium]